MPVRVLLLGARGRMGQAVAAAAEKANVEITAALDLGDEVTKYLGGCEVVIDFSNPGATATLSRACRDAKKPAVIGTTGHSDKDRALIEEMAKSVPVVFSPNFSVGVNALFWLTRKAAEMLGEGFDLEITEMHHRLKKDAPSGTAKKLAEVLCEARQLDYDKNVRHGRAGLVGERLAKEIGVHSLRGGDVVGDHTVTFAGAGERLELTHRAASRETFALGALRAAHWIVSRPPGLYTMEDVLGL
ncbi:MAG TPA: 4-hydroxy-tetrahydrodipicolinate reductase [Chthoniobacterales bacterium]|nr:4-hydroxy-tetrahydrodipicolinate reductase [Chthoniobacterales bacterium]